MEQENEGVVEVEETLDLPAEPAEGEEDSTDWKSEAIKLREKAIAQRERTKSYKAKLAEKDAAIAALAGEKKAPVSKTDELDETQLDYLDLKGINEDDDIKVIESIMKRTGQTVREALKDEYVVSKLAANKAKREVQDATPSSTKRAGGQTGDVATALAKFKSTGVLPTDRTLANAVTNAIANEGNVSVPPWQR